MMAAVFIAVSNKSLTLDPKEATGYDFYEQAEADKIINRQPTTSWLPRASWGFIQGTKHLGHLNWAPKN